LLEGARRARFLDEGHGPPLGAFANLEYSDTQCELQGEAILVLYTDGLVERRRTGLDEGLSALRAAACDAPQDPDLMCEYLIEKLVVDPTEDDIALLVVRPSSVGAGLLQLSHRSSPRATLEMRRVVRSWLRQGGVPERLCSDILVAVSEAHCNAVEHAYGLEPGPIEVDGSITGNAVEVTIRDHGMWRQRIARRNDDGGRGLILMRGLMDDVEIDTNGDGTEVRMRRSLEPQPSHF
jgi:anti-sigma regulatory factor (Ser/Thr protein kinase)